MWHTIITSLPAMISAMLQYTIPLAIISFIFGLILAVLTALIKFIKPSENKLIKYPWLVLRAIADFYVWLFRSTPLLVQLFIIFFGLPTTIAIHCCRYRFLNEHWGLCFRNHPFSLDVSPTRSMGCCFYIELYD